MFKSIKKMISNNDNQEKIAEKLMEPTKTESTKTAQEATEKKKHGEPGFCCGSCSS